ncbi:glycine--tRNA ligase [Candidatus Nomurabacteria bacterium RIFCSPHIGHO2_01_FULL_39_220]|uniref:Glycine--tRNA ligase n=1 Tax=Candidatus Nomurabacteria bacterium RIFCSPLOWO2_02_FULL_40_67 TaxID=1801787 RepID=A0A1F6Y477_9BACT|nr:MAG: Glycine-tRNA ligase [Parcubacteria group bacterium GW2011_GWA2_40_37]KKS73459.1 MAG: Glycine-tRNA ligase [Parcubacteria group bacterium GW2011_GWF2_42_7]OGI62092.1 MAG: glycine--tRNA ligase [Candidatus Nomurabacteria bacterium RBG_16_40_11]OGI70307.1 MAG: glycine--tRNA ligase [Candidatus Nomurabacteria bacterium RIFCSPHIGHO2_01_FULL_39_220]OGI73510.1 MAG: glycine--tRNA ligase [Candidatus Nomurabacteria bacterium RIFCSPHIGHO2_02_41_18]OGI78779.1 MAG: glycine--tRNA ligase [Candidatus Nom
MKKEKESKDGDLMEKMVSLCKRRGFVFPGSEIYGGFAGTYDWGHLGLALKNNIKQAWWKKFVDSRRDMYGMDAAILMNPKVWEATGHVANFADPLDGKQFNTMLKTSVGARKDEVSVSYLRPETAQGMFVNFKNTVDAFHPKLPFGMAQIGKAFRNEIAPRDFLFRQREFEQMEIEYFVRPADWEKYFEYWRGEIRSWMEKIGLDMNKVHELEVAKEDRAHYSSRTIDFEFDYPFGKKELFGLAYRSDFDLKTHKLEYQDEENGEKMILHVIEPTFGVDRAFMALLLSAYTEDPAKDGASEKEPRVYLKFKPNIAPVICAVSPLLKNKPELVKYAEGKVFVPLKAEFGRVVWDDNGNIGKRYRRQDEIGTPFCIVVDFDTLEDNTVTVRDRDTGAQERVKVEELKNYLKEKIL